MKQNTEGKQDLESKRVLLNLHNGAVDIGTRCLSNIPPPARSAWIPCLGQSMLWSESLMGHQEELPRTARAEVSLAVDTWVPHGTCLAPVWHHLHRTATMLDKQCSKSIITPFVRKTGKSIIKVNKIEGKISYYPATHKCNIPLSAFNCKHSYNNTLIY